MRLAGRDLGIPRERERERETGIFWGCFSLSLTLHWHCWLRSRARLWWQVVVVVRALTFPSCEIMSFNKPDRSYKPSHSTPREGSADLQRKVDCSAAMETGLVLNPIIKQRLSNNRSGPTCTKDILGCGLIPELCGIDFALCKVIW